MIYFDNSSSTYFKPPEVMRAVSTVMEYLPVNGSRASHSLAMKANKLIMITRERVAELVKCQPERVIFTGGCTEALNLAIFGTYIEGGHVVTTAFEHNSVLRPLFELKRQGKISLTIVAPENGKITVQRIAEAMTPRTYLVAVNAVSNVTGASADIASIGKLARSRNALLLADGAQWIGYDDVDMQKSNIDMLAIAPHKGLHGIQGVGVLALSERAKLRPIKFGGTGTASSSPYQPYDMPEGYEAGTLPLPAIGGLCAAIRYTELHAEQNRLKLLALSDYANKKLSNLSRIKMYSAPDSYVIALNVHNLSAGIVGDILSEQYDIAVRCGLHCAPLLHSYYSTLSDGMVRVSLGIDNTYDDINCLITALDEISHQ